MLFKTDIAKETIWATQAQIAEVFRVERSVITKHICNILKDKELDEKQVCAKFAHTAADGKTYNVQHYNLDIILAVGYRTNSGRAISFRQWATKILKEFILKGFTIDDEKLKNGRYFGKDYFAELLERVRSIRASERRIYWRVSSAESSFCYFFLRKEKVRLSFLEKEKWRGAKQKPFSCEKGFCLFLSIRDYSCLNLCLFVFKVSLPLLDFFFQKQKLLFWFPYRCLYDYRRQS